MRTILIALLALACSDGDTFELRAATPEECPQGGSVFVKNGEEFPVCQTGTPGPAGKPGVPGPQGATGAPGATGARGADGAGVTIAGSVLCQANTTNEFWESYATVFSDGTVIGVCRWSRFEDQRDGFFIGAVCTLVVPGPEGVTTFDIKKQSFTDGTGGPFRLDCQ